ncbi:MAG: glycoside hydrolase family 2 TIM barrel-domain containing protein [Pyrinomonadaceae bacterium]
MISLSCVVAIAGQSVPRPEHPRPDLVRAQWQTLNGQWEFEFDDQNRGMAEGWYKAPARKFSRTIQVPFAFQTKLSGINDPSYHDVVWYRRTIDVPPDFRSRDKRVMLNFGAVDYEAIVWVNGERVGDHRGGHVPFSFDVTDLLKEGKNSVVVRAFDPSTDRTIPRGKQFWEPKSAVIWYTRTSGIWQPVWLEAVGIVHVKRLRITPDVDHNRVEIETILNRPAEAGEKLRFTATIRNNPAAMTEISAETSGGANPLATLHLNNQELWSPERPNLYDLRVELIGADGSVADRVDSYFGQRKVHVYQGKVYLNNNPYYQKLVLDQGYWPDSTLTPPTDEAIKYDVEMAKKFGFNGARKHQKVEDPRWLYWCDKLGFLVWGEMANAFDIYNDEYIARFTDEWQQVIARDYNHPSIIAWTPINESWGVFKIATDRQQQDHARAMYYLIHSLDTTRLVQDNDGWEHTDATDIFGVHDYSGGSELTERYKILETDRTRVPRNGKDATAFGYQYNGSPIIITEFGGVPYRMDEPKKSNEFGYGNVEPTKEAFLKRLDSTVTALRNNKAIVGYCYTQLTDVEQEINGLMTYDRRPKVSPEEFAKIFNK